MPRCKKKRYCRFIENEKVYKPIKIPLNQIDIVEINLDEFEALRLCDFENKSQIEAADIMGVSRGTVQRLVESGRRKIIDAFLNDKGIIIKKSY